MRARRKWPTFTARSERQPERARWLAARTSLDPTAIWEWGVVERVSTGLLCTKIDLQPVGREMLAVADHVAEESLRFRQPDRALIPDEAS